MTTTRAAPAGAASGAALRERIRAEAHRLGFDLVGFAPVAPSEHGAFYRAWIAAGRHGEMAYLAREDAVARRLRPDEAFPGLRTAIVVALDYAPRAEAGNEGVDPSRGVIARYARGRDYHRVVKQKLLELLRWIEAGVGEALPRARAYVDTGPVLERELARRAGLGWFGRNTMLIHPRRGSYLFLGVLLVELELPPDEPFSADHCGRCAACVEACPTGALLGRDASGAPVIDATRCISYLTIELRGPIPRALRPLIGNRIFGCDICQEACPFTRKFTRPTREPSFAERGAGEPPVGVQAAKGAWTMHPGTSAPPLVALLDTALDEAAWDAFSRGSALRRAGRAGFARNVCIGLGNAGAPEAVPVLARALRDPEPLVRAHAAWALGRVASPEARSTLEEALATEEDGRVREEILLALSEAEPSE